MEAAHEDGGLAALLARVLESAKWLSLDVLPQMVADHASAFGLADLQLFVVDYEQLTLRPLGVDAEVIDIDGSVAGRAFIRVEPFHMERDGGWEVWLPLVDGSDRMGVMRVHTADVDALTWHRCLRLADLVAELVVVKSAYSDVLQRARRTRDMTLAAELQWSQLPPLTFTSSEVAISAVLEPSYEIAGDVFDYTVDSHRVCVAVLDAMGHGLEACRMASLALAAYRHARRHDVALPETYNAVDAVISATFGPEKFVTGLLAELDLVDGRLRWINAGHPPPMLLRGRKVISELDSEPVLPMGFGGETGAVKEAALEPGDRLVLFTDGVVEARSPSGEFLGVNGLIEALGREAAGETRAAEQLRRLARGVLAHQQGPLRDDATALMCEWRGDGRRA